MKKKMISMCMMVALLLGILSNIVLSVRAETIVSGTSEEGFYWELDGEGTLTISGEGQMADYYSAGAASAVSWLDANLREYINQINKIIINPGITRIGSSAFAFCSMVSVELPNTVESIEDNAFLCCKKLKTIVIPDSATTIGSAFNQSGLTEITIPANVIHIDRGAFWLCEDLTTITFLGNAPDIGNEFGQSIFEEIPITAYYPKDNPTWIPDVMQNYGGILTWVPMDSLGNTNSIEKSPSLFVSVIESRMADCGFNSLGAEKQSECRGILIDLDSDGNDELILRYLDKWDDLIFEVWKIQNETMSCINTATLFSGGMGTNGSLSSATYEGKQYLVYQWLNSGMDYVNDLSEVYCLIDGKYELSSSAILSNLGELITLMRSNYAIDENEEPEGTVFDELISLLQNKSDVDTNNGDCVDDKLEHFLLQNDGWSFANAAESFAEEPASHADDYFIPRERYDALFGSSYVDSTEGLYTEKWKGNCAGMSATAILFFLDKLDWEVIDTKYSEDFFYPNSFYRTVNLHNRSQSYYPAIGNDTEVTRLIEAYQLYINAIDKSSLVETLDNTYFEDDVTEKKTLFGSEYIVNHVAEGTYITTMLAEFQEAYNENKPLLIVLQADGFGHGIVSRTDLQPEDMGDGWWRVYVYDPNKPYINESVCSIVSGVEAEPKYTFGCNELIDNGGDIYLELNPSLNQWRYCTSVNSNSTGNYIGSSPSGKLLWKSYYHDSTPNNENDDEGKKNNAKIPEFFYTIDLTGLTLEDFLNPHFDSTSAWIPQNDLAVAVDGSTDCSIYASTGELVAIVEDGDAFMLSDAGTYDAYIGQSEHGGFLGGKIYLPNDVYTVYYTSGIVQFLGSENALSFSCKGAAELTVDITLNSVQIIAQEDGIAAVKCANVTSTDECSYVGTEGALVAGETFAIVYSDENEVIAETNSKEGTFTLYQKECGQAEAIKTGTISANNYLWLWIIGGIGVCAIISASIAVVILVKRKK